MESELTSLEGKLAALISAYQQSCESNRALHEQVTALQAENKRLSDKLAVVVERVESILERLPEEQS